MPLAQLEPISSSTKINENGRILIPAAMREQMNLKPGDSVVLTLENGILRVESYLAIIRKIQEDFKQFRKPGVSVVDEFIAEKREEARREMEEYGA
jgi:AbrB family looped-hinge helix DNA binding protein